MRQAISPIPEPGGVGRPASAVRRPRVDGSAFGPGSAPAGLPDAVAADAPGQGAAETSGAAGEGGLTDEQVIAAVLSGQAAWFELIMRRYKRRLFRVARGVLGNDADAEDAVQEAYLSAFEHLPDFEGRSSFATWLTRIALHSALGVRRKRKNMASLDFNADDRTADPVASPGRTADDVAGDRELGGVLSDAIDRLPTELRTVFVLRVVEDLDTLETARCLELTEANVKVRLHRARTRLRRDIDDRLGVEARRLYQFDGHRCDRLVAAVMARIGGAAG